jgi:hypothetical protein
LQTVLSVVAQTGRRLAWSARRYDRIETIHIPLEGSASGGQPGLRGGPLLSRLRSGSVDPLPQGGREQRWRPGQLRSERLRRLAIHDRGMGHRRLEQLSRQP